MSKNNSLGIDLDSLGDAMKGMQDAFAQGLGAIDQVNEEVAQDMEPTHKIIINVNLSAKVEGHDYLVDAKLIFKADLNSILKAQGGDIASLLGGLDVDLSDKEAGQVAEQLGQPRCIAVLDDYKVNELKLSSDKGKLEKGINEKATMLITLNKNKLSFSFESVFALPKEQAKQTVYTVIPSQEQMQKHVVVEKEKLEKKITFSWMEKDKDNLKIKGDLQILKI